MDYEVPEYYQLAGVGHGDDGSLRVLDEHYFTNELLELLRHGGDDGGGGAGSSATHGPVDAKPSLDPPDPPRPPTTAATSTASDQLTQPSARALPGEAEMASWLCQVFEEASDHEPRRQYTTTKTGGSTVRSSRDSAAAAGASTGALAATADANNKAECCRGRRHRPLSGGRRSCSGRAAEQRRRDKINDKMRTLQQLVPRCSKTDKASTLEEVIRYVQSLQHQVQVLSNGYAMPTAILPAGVVPPCMQPAGDVFGGQPVMMLPQYPFVPAVFACPRHGNGGVPPPPPSLPYGRHPTGRPATQQFVHRHPVPDDHAVPSHKKADSHMISSKRS